MPASSSFPWTRIALWSAALAAVALVLFFIESQRPPSGEPEAPSAAAAEPTEPPAAPAGPALRFGVLPRAAHLVALSALEMGLYDVALLGRGAVRPSVFLTGPQERSAFERGDLDLAVLPLRDAVAVSAGGHGRIVAGCALGDEVWLASRQLARPDEVPWRGLRVGLLEPPRLDLARLLADGPDVSVASLEEIQRFLLAGRLDLALLPEPDAHAVAPLARARPVSLPAGHPRRPISGAALVVSRRLLERDREAVARLVGMHAVSADGYVARDPETAVRRATALLASLDRPGPPAAIWLAALPEVRPGFDLPVAEIERLADLMAEETGAPVPVEELVDPSFVEQARRDLAEFDRDG